MGDSPLAVTSLLTSILTPPATPKEELFAGMVLRRIPNLKSRFKKPHIKPGNFRAAPEDHGRISVHLAEIVDPETVLKLMAEDPLLKPFGLCSLEIGRIRAVTNGAVRAFFDPDGSDQKFGHAHVILTGCHVDLPHVHAALAEIAVLIEPPTEPLR